LLSNPAGLWIPCLVAIMLKRFARFIAIVGCVANQADP